MTTISRVAARHALTGRELPSDEPHCDDCGVQLQEADLLSIAAERTAESWTISRCWCAGCAPQSPRDTDETVLAEGTVGLQSDPRRRRHHSVPVDVTVVNGHIGVPEGAL